MSERLRLPMASFRDDDSAACEYWEPSDAKLVDGTDGVLWTHSAYGGLLHCWQVTHGPTGRSLCHDFISREEAEQFAVEVWTKLTDRARGIWKTAMTQQDARDATPDEVKKLVHRVSMSNTIRAEKDDEETAS